jgi:hypothetical protein
LSTGVQQLTGFMTFAFFGPKTSASWTSTGTNRVVPAFVLAG